MTISPTELARRLQAGDGLCLLDVRQPEENALGALPDSRLIPLGELMERVGELADWREREVVVYCHHGIRSAQALAYLRSLGFNRLWNLVGGVDRWSREVDSTFPRY